MLKTIGVYMTDQGTGSPIAGLQQLCLFYETRCHFILVTVWPGPGKQGMQGIYLFWTILNKILKQNWFSESDSGLVGLPVLISHLGVTDQLVRDTDNVSHSTTSYNYKRPCGSVGWQSTFFLCCQSTFPELLMVTNVCFFFHQSSL